MQQTPITDSQSKVWNKNTIIFLADMGLFFILLNILPFEPAANKGLALLAFVAILWLTEAVNVTITALFVPILSVLLGLVNSREALVAFADPTIFLFFGGFALATALNVQKIDQMISNKIMQLARGRLSVAVLYLFIATAFLSMWMSNTATAAMMIPLSMTILSQLDQKEEHNTYVFVLLGIAYSATIGGMGTLVGSPPNAIAASQLHLGFADWLMYGTPVMLILFPLIIGWLYLVFKPTLGLRFDAEFAKIHMTKKRILTLTIFVTVAILWIFGGYINPILSQLLGLPKPIGSFDSMVALSAAIVICVTGIASWKEIQENTEWGVLFLFGGGLTLSSVLTQSGASKIMADGIVFIIEGGHYYVMALIVATFIVCLTEFTSNTASAALLVPIFISIAQALNMPPLGFAMIIGLGASCAFMMPVGTPPNAIVYSTGFVKQSEMIRVGKFIDLTCMLIIGTIAYLFWM
ncbi:DASS family sodium-coupled anion symporter [Haemophilus parainfluenzae]|jgi:transporter, DASS family|uniref:DASS family sodium-coupled anion symporter n=1 Tax=Haemophilus parainfluenzae TaxID=729 RepID=UPI0009680268|nr:DASS family sodium-coupled anion symporter [Haemophilus parainfluenzae]MDU3249789.1 DASS family sodium-coupled anion symporter [Haemophilus parainfluenzae]MDU5638580.1 DASS family sodium-coupled anion symporter [Haemophilus parainfluenzae]OLV29265.1 transporter [Haemophilus parainfluenzae]